jgi:chromosome partitioning protein
VQVLAIASRKGGAGKTTVTGHLAVAAEEAGFGPVAIVDLDPQGSLADWWIRRERKYPQFLQTSLSRLREDIAALRDLGIKLLFIDTPPALTSVIQQVIALADLVLLPIRPSPHDLRSVGATLDVVQALGKPFLFVLNAASQRARITQEARAVLTQCGEVAASTLHLRVDFAASMVDGRTVMEIADADKSSMEIRKLWREVKEKIELKNGATTVSRLEFSACMAGPKVQPFLGGQVTRHG